MLYRFHSRVTSDVLMLEPQGEALLRAIGREPSPRGIIEPSAMAEALERLHQAIAAQEEAARVLPQEDEAQREQVAEATGRDPVSLRSRWWPMIDMLRRAQREGQCIVWST
jgi:hypothetical protein